MKTIFCIPPIPHKKNLTAQASQNRQYQFFKDNTFIFPVIPATFVSMLLTEPNHEVLWIDSIAEGLNEVEFGKIIVDMKPDYIVFEANTMVFKRYCEVINGIKANLPQIKILFAGEHPTAMPEEAKTKSKADFILHGGKWFYEAFKIITGKVWPVEKTLPHINREAARWWLYAFNNGNFKYIPATYTMASMDCWYRPKQPCTFCSWVSYHPNTTTRTVEDFLEEVEGLINFGFKEFFDDSGTFPVGKWLREFCNEMIERGYNRYIHWGCNMRFGALQPEDFLLMKKAGCRFILWGFESSNQKTLDMLSKGYKVEDMRKDLIIARMAGIWNHLTCMQGYPWETLEEEKRTVKMVKWLLVNDWASSAQSTICMPYPGTRLFEQCKEEGWLLNENWEDWDMSKPVMKLQYDYREALKSQKAIYDTSYNPRFIWNKISKIRTTDDLKFYWRLSKKVVNRFSTIFDNQGVSINAK
jgi:anaerobic magnesium-protoporphyrin IX monomethyl ester cyclase